MYFDLKKCFLHILNNYFKSLLFPPKIVFEMHCRLGSSEMMNDELYVYIYSNSFNEIIVHVSREPIRSSVCHCIAA